MVREDAEQVHLVISHAVMKAFRAEISVDRPFFEKGYLSEMAEWAFQLLIIHLRNKRRSKQHTTLDMHNAKVQQELTDLKDGIITYMVSEGYWEDYSTINNRIFRKHLIEAIKFVRNIKDSRPVNTWLRRLLEAELIEGVDVNLSEIARNVSISIKTVHRRLLKMQKSRILQFTILPNPQAIKGQIVFFFGNQS